MNNLQKKVLKVVLGVAGFICVMIIRGGLPAPTTIGVLILSILFHIWAVPNHNIGKAFFLCWLFPLYMLSHLGFWPPLVVIAADWLRNRKKPESLSTT